METEQRLLQLERSTARLRWLCGLLILGLIGSVALQGAYIYRQWHKARHAPAVAEFVQARRFILINQSGQECAVLGVSEDGAFLELDDRQGRKRALLDVRATGPGLTLLDDRNVVRALLAVEGAGPFLGLADTNGDDLFKAP